MVKIAVAGGYSQVGGEVVDVLLTRNHDVLFLSRKDAPVEADPSRSAPPWIKVDYEDSFVLEHALRGIEVVLSFIGGDLGPSTNSQKNLIDAAVRAGVKRFAPSEWATSGVDNMPWYAGKAEIRRYLQELNKTEQVIEYCLFQPGWFTDYLLFPHFTTKHFRPFQSHIDFANRRAIIRAGGRDDRITFTTVRDFANIVARAVEYEGAWPIVGGICGTDLTVGEVIALGEKLRGGEFDIEELQANDLRAGVVGASWKPRVTHASIPPEIVNLFADKFLAGVLLSVGAGEWKVTDEWNQLFDDFVFKGAEEFLSGFWLESKY